MSQKQEGGKSKADKTKAVKASTEEIKANPPRRKNSTTLASKKKIPAAIEILPLAKTSRKLQTYSSTDSDGSTLPADIGERLQKAIESRQKGRASTFHEDKAVKVLELMITGLTTQEACKKTKIPISTWYVWRSVVPGLLDATLQAQELQADSQIDEADRMLRQVDIEKIDPKRANAALRKVQQIADYRFNLAKCRNFKAYGDKKAQLNMNLNAEVTDADVSKWFNR